MISQAKKGRELNPANPRSPRHAEWLKRSAVSRKQSKRRQAQLGLLGLSDAAKVAGFSPYAIRKMITENQLPVVVIGKRLFIRRADLAKFLRSVAA